MSAAVAVALRLRCGHDSRSVDGCLDCEAADAILALPAGQKKLADLVLKLADAVDNAMHDIGGSRPQLTILREAVAYAQSIKAAT